MLHIRLDYVFTVYGVFAVPVIRYASASRLMRAARRRFIRGSAARSAIEDVERGPP